MKELYVVVILENPFYITTNSDVKFYFLQINICKFGQQMKPAPASHFDTHMKICSRILSCPLENSSAFFNAFCPSCKFHVLDVSL